MPDEQLLTDTAPAHLERRARFDGGDRTVVRGPLSDAGLIAGFWIWKVSSFDEAINWVKRCLNPMGIKSKIEIRQIFEAGGETAR